MVRDWSTEKHCSRQFWNAVEREPVRLESSIQKHVGGPSPLQKKNWEKKNLYGNTAIVYIDAMYRNTNIVYIDAIYGNTTIVYIDAMYGNTTIVYIDAIGGKLHQSS